MSIVKKPHRFALKGAVALAIAGGFSSSAWACGPDSFAGTVCTFAFNYCPQGWVQADGRTLNVNSNQVLFALLGTTFGGDGRNTFGIPDLRGRTVVGSGTGPNLAGINYGQIIGQQAVTLTTAQTPLPAHTHGATFTGTGGGGTQTVNIPAVASTLDVKATLSARKIAGVASPDKDFLLGQGGTGTNSAPIYVNPTTSGTDVNLGGLSVSLAGTPGNPALSFNVPVGITGGTVVVQNNLPVAATTPVSTQSPGLGLTTCILATGLYPSRP